MAMAGGMAGQAGFFDFDRRLQSISAKGDPLETINSIVPWESFRATIEDATLTPPDSKKSNAGRPAYDAILKFKMLVLAALYNLSDESLEFQVRDRLSFMRFLGLELHHAVPDATTIWLFREALVKTGKIDALFDLFKQHLEAKGFIARDGQIIDATIVEAPRQHNTRAENEEVKAGKTPEEWEKKPAKNRQKDKDARWTKKHGKSYFGYKNHIGIDRTNKLIRTWDVTDASVHDSQKLDDVLDADNTGRDVWADSAYRSQAAETRLAEKGYNSRIHFRAYRDNPLDETQKNANRARSEVRARVEHIFGDMTMGMGDTIVRTIGAARARFKIGMMNLGYNVRRLGALERMAAASA
jgi:IS5 family transposase